MHLRVLHRIAEQGPSIMIVKTTSDRIYVTPPSPTGRVFLKVIPWCCLYKVYTNLRHPWWCGTAHHHSPGGGPATRPTRKEGGYGPSNHSPWCYPTGGTISPVSAFIPAQTEQKVQPSWCILCASPDSNWADVPNQETSAELLSQGIPLPSFSKTQPLLLIGSNNPGLIAAKKPIWLGTGGEAAAVHTQLGWVLKRTRWASSAPGITSTVLTHFPFFSARCCSSTGRMAVAVGHSPLPQQELVMR